MAAENGGNTRADELMNYIDRLNQGESLESVQEDFRKNFGSVDAADIVDAEKNMIQNGTPISQVQKLCDIHSALFHGDTREERIDNAEDAVRQSMEKREAGRRIPANVSNMPSAKSAETEGHPLNILTLENREFMKRLDRLQQLLETGADAEAVLDSLKDLTRSGAHYDKKDELILPALKRHGVRGPADVMWNVDVEIRKTNKALAGELSGQAAQAAGDAGTQVQGAGVQQDLREKIEKLAARMREMIFKEEKILFPLSEKNLTAEEWQLIYRDLPRFGFSWITDIPEWKEADKAEKQTASVLSDGAVKDAEIQLPTGKLSLAELEGILRTLPVELTFIDAKDTSRYFSENSTLFPRPLSALGRKVYECHPPQVIAIVQNVINQLRSGEKNVVSFVAPKHGRKAYVRYMAVRSEKGEYLGTLEVVEDITDLD